MQLHQFYNNKRCDEQLNNLNASNGQNVLSTLFTKFKTLILLTFLPAGYPESVSDDYLEYQFFDTLQALCSSLNGSLAQYSVLKTLGVGDSSATVLSATLTWILRDGCGMIANIIFISKKSNMLDNHPKQWRLTADILNDLAMLIELLFSSPYVLCVSSMFRAVVGVAGGATRTPIIMHQAKRGSNFADVQAKDSAQETVVNLIALCLNVVFVPRIVQNRVLTWCFFMFFMIMHIFFNYRGVKAVKSNLLNYYRLKVVLEKKVYGVNEVNDEEEIFKALVPRDSWCLGAEIKNKNLNFDFVDDTILVDSGGKKIHLVKDASRKDVLKCYLLANLGYKMDKCDDVLEKLEAAGWNLEDHRLFVDEWRFSKVQ
jgi:hypothetical protein